jgi:prevent-host-death family protein
LPKDQTSVMTSYMASRWSVQDAKARFSEFLQTSLTEGPQIVTKRGTEAAVLVPIEEWRRLQRAARPGLKSLLQERPGVDIPETKRGRLRRRAASAAT